MKQGESEREVYRNIMRGIGRSGENIYTVVANVAKAGATLETEGELGNMRLRYAATPKGVTCEGVIAARRSGDRWVRIEKTSLTRYYMSHSE